MNGIYTQIQRYPSCQPAACSRESYTFGALYRKRALSVALHGTLGSYQRDALQEGSADAVACLPVPRA
jgi:hypothetical protein